MKRTLVLSWMLLPAALLIAGCSGETEPQGDDADTDTDTDSDTDTDTDTDIFDPERFSVTDCPEHIERAFLDISAAPGAGPGYALPSMHITCDDELVSVVSNGIPHYTFVQMTPMDLVEEERTHQFPVNPQVAAEPTSPLRNNGNPRLGYFGAAVNGIAFFGPTEATQGPPGTVPYGDPVYNGLTDGCFGHGAPHHYHSFKERCLVDEGLVATPWTNSYVAGDEPSPIVAFAADGFPVYGSWECVDVDCSEVHEMKSGWQLKPGGSLKVEVWKHVEYVASDDATVLDACNGHDIDDRGYHYHHTETFPYIIGCFAGSPVGLGGPN